MSQERNQIRFANHDFQRSNIKYNNQSYGNSVSLFRQSSVDPEKRKLSVKSQHYER